MNRDVLNSYVEEFGENEYTKLQMSTLELVEKFKLTDEDLDYINSLEKRGVLKHISQTNILTTEEVCKVLGRTRQQLSNYVKNGDIPILKKEANGNLFWRADVFDFMKNHPRKFDISNIII